MKLINECSACEGMVIEPGGRAEYEELERFHYRGDRFGAYAAIYVLRDMRAARRGVSTGLAGVIVYTMPAGALEIRNIATGGFFCGVGSRAAQNELANRYIRCISRVIIEPRYRGLGLAAQLVRRTMPLMNVPVIEAMAVMGQINPFFERAGMKPYHAARSKRCEIMAEALAVVGIEGGDLIDHVAAQARLESLVTGERAWIEHHITKFLDNYGMYKKICCDFERMKFVLSKLGQRPVYYLWKNTDLM
jgi:GNAT superfamily N-acetyltransferase